jgi:hypothetical protein
VRRGKGPVPSLVMAVMHPRAPVFHRATATAPIPGRVLTTHFYVMLMWSGVGASPGTARDGPVPATGGEAVPPQRPPATGSATVTQPAPAPALSGVDIVAKLADGKDRDIMTKYGFNLRGAKVGWAWAGCGYTKGHYYLLPTDLRNRQYPLSLSPPSLRSVR